MFGCYYDNNRRKKFNDGWAGKNKKHRHYGGRECSMIQRPAPTHGRMQGSDAHAGAYRSLFCFVLLIELSLCHYFSWVAVFRSPHWLIFVNKPRFSGGALRRPLEPVVS
jgi:hypothetical protein